MPEKNVLDRLADYVEEAFDLRHGLVEGDEGKITLPHQQEGQEALLNSLFRLRQRLDRVEEILSLTTRIKARLVRRRDDLKFEAELKFNQSLQQEGSRRIEFQSAAERKANASLEAFEEKRKEYQAEKLVAEASTAVEVIQQSYWGLNRLREDHLALLRSYNSFESAIERTSQKTL